MQTNPTPAPLTISALRPSPQWWGQLPYEDALARMTDLHGARVAGECADQFCYLEHPPVITYGRAPPAEELTLGAPHIPRLAVPRGGLATYHAPGQLVGYIIMDLRNRNHPAGPDIHAYLRAIELGLIAFLETEFHLPAGLREGFTGVWTPPDPATGQPGRKLASIGVSARRWVTSHGFALNICPDMSGFDAIVPCGIRDARMTSVREELAWQDQPFDLKPMETWAHHAHTHLIQALQNAGWLQTEETETSTHKTSDSEK